MALIQILLFLLISDLHIEYIFYYNAIRVFSVHSFGSFSKKKRFFKADQLKISYDSSELEFRGIQLVIL